MIEVHINVNVDGVTYAIDKDEPSNPGRNSTLRALTFFQSQVARIERIMKADVPDSEQGLVIEKRTNVDSGAVSVKPITRC